MTEAIVEEDEEEPQDETIATEDIDAANETPVDQFKTPGRVVNESSILVGVRVRPLGESEENVVDIADTQVVVAAEKVFNFDLMFDHESSQNVVYNELVHDRVKSVIEGYNATVFAYGQTGTGKTFTMGTSNNDSMVEDDNRGVIIRALQQVFREYDSHSVDNKYLTIKISFLEIAKGQVYDLLNPTKTKVPLSVREVQPGSFRVMQLTELEVQSIVEAVDLLSRGSLVRTTEATAVNSQSSRSHAIFSISLVSADNDGNTVTRKLNLVDLAGSESQAKTGAVGKRFEEAKGINLGLTVLNRVITGLSKRQGHIPYRDSILTKVLKESLEAHCHVSMLACISPSEKDVNETVSTLRFSNEAKQLKTKPLPAKLLDSCRASVARKKAAGLGIPSTPLNRANNTFHGLTPGTSGSGAGSKRPAFNRTIGTPGKRSRMEQSYVHDMNAMKENPMTSTVSKNILVDSLCDLSSVSMIEPPTEAPSTSTITNTISNAHDMTGLLSPLMRTIRENMQEEFEKLKTDLISSRALNKTPAKSAKTSLKMAKSRATSSPNKTTFALADMSEESDLAPSNIEVTGADKENFISGVGVSFPQPPRSVNPRLRAVMESASPDLNRHEPVLFHYDSPPSSSQAGRNPKSPTIEEMERTLGINPDSPSLMFSVNKAPAVDLDGTVLRKSRKSSRRTTMMASELNETLKEIQNIASSNRRRSVRVAAQGKYYGSPSQLSKENETQEEASEDASDGSQFNHPLLNNPKKMDPVKQQKHNEVILNFINIGNVKLLGVSLI